MGGLKYIFPILAGKALKGKEPESALDVKLKAIGIIYNLKNSNVANIGERILGKFIENDGKNLEKLLELRLDIFDKLGVINSSKLLILQALDIEDPDCEQAEMIMDQKRTENGYMELLYIDYLLEGLIKDSQIVRKF
jgi:hypothetical protein